MKNEFYITLRVMYNDKETGKNIEWANGVIDPDNVFTAETELRWYLLEDENFKELYNAENVEKVTAEYTFRDIKITTTFSKEYVDKL